MNIEMMELHAVRLHAKELVDVVEMHMMILAVEHFLYADADVECLDRIPMKTCHLTMCVILMAKSTL
jgi:hypothetical protein